MFTSAKLLQNSLRLQRVAMAAARDPSLLQKCEQFLLHPTVRALSLAQRVDFLEKKVSTNSPLSNTPLSNTPLSSY